ncbi:MAG: hypothetical protein IT324_17645 [Anaerolineae bacterium]|nr:hypothetical protein [Anaerolineae bacterium]
MTKKAVVSPPAARHVPNPLLDRLAGWLARRSRLTRLLIAGVIALILTGALSLFLFGYLFAMPSGTFNVGPFDPSNILTITLAVLAVLGIVFYGIGWRVLVGFDLGDENLRPGRPAALWVLFAIIVLLGTVCLTIFLAVIAVAPG